MSLWMVRAGKHGEQEDLALENGIAVIGWDELSDLSKFESEGELEGVLRQTYPDIADGAIYQWRSQLWRFSHVIKEGDLVVLPLKTRSALAVGRVTGAYQHRPELDGAGHTRPVNWIRDDLPRTAIDQDLLYSLGASQTICQISRNQAEDRFEALLKGGVALPGASIGSPEEESADTDVDLEQVAQDRIQAFITRRFAGHDLTRLVAALLEAQGYTTVQSPAGPDGGGRRYRRQRPDGIRLAANVCSGKVRQQPRGRESLPRTQVCSGRFRRRARAAGVLGRIQQVRLQRGAEILLPNAVVGRW